jgi:hypothetical protein
MNGRVLVDLIELNNSSKSIYAIQMAEIMNQQFEAFLGKTRMVSRASKNVYENQIENIKSNISIAKSYFLANNYSEALEKAEIEEVKARIFLSALTFQYSSVLNLIRNLIMISIYTIIIAILFFLERRKIIEITHSKVFTRELLLPEILGASLTIILIVGMFLIFGFDYSATQFNSAPQALTPNLTAFGLLIIFGIFSPWLFTFLLLRKKKENYKKFKDWKAVFMRATIGSITIISIPIFTFFLYYISKNGPWPSWILPRIAEYYAYMVIVNLSCFVYLIAIVLMIILWKQQKHIEQSKKAI